MDKVIVDVARFGIAAKIVKDAGAEQRNPVLVARRTGWRHGVERCHRFLASVGQILAPGKLFTRPVIGATSADRVPIQWQRLGLPSSRDQRVSITDAVGCRLSQVQRIPRGPELPLRIELLDDLGLRLPDMAVVLHPRKHLDDHISE